MNRVILMGRLTRDPDVSYTQKDNSAVARFTLAVDRRVARNADSNQQTADFINCVTFGKTAEFAEKYLKKGTKVVAEGRIQTGSYKNKDGNTVYTTDVVLDNVEFAESKNSALGNSGNYGNSDQKQNFEGSDSGFMNITESLDDQLPF